MGKSTEMKVLAASEDADDSCVSFVEIQDRHPSFAASLRELAMRGRGSLFLDALDELLLRDPSAVRVVMTELAKACARAELRLRVSCRGTVWPARLEHAIREALSGRSGDDGGADTQFLVVNLQPLTLDDVRVAAACSLGDRAGAFVDGLANRDLLRWAEDPKGLHDLLDYFANRGSYPERVVDLLEVVADRRLMDSPERRDDGTEVAIGLPELAASSEWLGLLSLLAGRAEVCLSDRRTDDALGEPELACLADIEPRLDSRMLRAMRATALFDRGADDRFRFAHRTWSEYFAARRLARLPLRAIRSLLCDPGDRWRRISGPLRETASFVAMISTEFARWLAEKDPEVIGLSDVADDGLRRAAFARVLEAATESGTPMGHIEPRVAELSGFRYPLMETDVQVALGQCRDARGLNALLGVIAELRLSGLADACAALALDGTLELGARQLAARIVRDLGDDPVKRRLLPLCDGEECDSKDELKGIALQALWPLSGDGGQLLHHLSPPRRRHHIGAYRLFLRDLAMKGYDGPADLWAALDWAERLVRCLGDDKSLGHEPSSEHLDGILRLVVLRALEKAASADVARRLAAVMTLASDASIWPPLPLPPRWPADIDANRWMSRLATALTREATRRGFLDAISAGAREPIDAVRLVAPITPALVLADFAWMLDRASDPRNDEGSRRAIALLASRVPDWLDCLDATQDWLSRTDCEPIRESFGRFTATTLDSPHARAERDLWLARNAPTAPRRTRRDPLACLRQTLALAAPERVARFPEIAWRLSQSPERPGGELLANLRRAPLWDAIEPGERVIIIETAQASLGHDLKGVGEFGVMEALLLVAGESEKSLASVPHEWWRRFGFDLVVDLGRMVPKEVGEARSRLVDHVLDAALPDFLNALEVEVRSSSEHARHRIDSALGQLTPSSPPEISRRLRELVGSGAASPSTLNPIVGYLLTTDPVQAVDCLRSLVTTAGKLDLHDLASEALAQLVSTGDTKTARRLLDDDCGARSVLLRLAVNGMRVEPLLRARDGGDSDSVSFLGTLAHLLVRVFPFVDDPEHDGAYSPSPDDEARRLRDQLLHSLAFQCGTPGLKALDEFRGLAADTAARIADLRTIASREHRLSRWTPHEPRTIVEVVGAASKRLIRCEGDILDGIEDALEAMQRSLDRDGGDPRRDFWGEPHDGAMHPKLEAHCSNRLASAIREAFARECVVAGREVEIRPRQVPDALDGDPGSRPDLMIEVPALGTVRSEPLRIPLEAKLSYNREAETNMAAQLAARYIVEVRSSGGIFVVYWFDGPCIPEKKKPIWRSAEHAREVLLDQAIQLRRSKGLDIRPFVLDLSLR